MKHKVFIVAGALAIFAVTLLIYKRERLNVEYLCYRAHDISDQVNKSNLDEMQKIMFIADQLQDIMYTKDLRNVFQSLAMISNDQKGDFFQDGLRQITNDQEYRCPALMKLMGFEDP